MALLNHQLCIQGIATFIDPTHPVDRAIITHGHADHARAGHGHVMATRETIAIMKARYGEHCAGTFEALELRTPKRLGDVSIALYPAGHVLGSAQVLVEGRGERALVTGDFKRGSDRTCAPFEVVPCDTLVTEATFALPVFQHPDPREEIEKLLHSVARQPDRTHLVGAYALGKAQRVIGLLRDAGYEAPLYLHGALTKLCQLYESFGVPLGELRPATLEHKADFAGAIVLAPPSAMRDRWARRFPDPVVAMASGWMQVKQRARQSGVELPLVISDHADWNELLQTIDDTGAQRVWITHGREDALAYQCQQKGLEAEPLHLQGREEEGGE